MREGLRVVEVVSEFGSAPRNAGDDEFAELDRRYARATEGSRVPHQRVVQWLRTWGTPGFRQWPDHVTVRRRGSNDRSDAVGMLPNTGPLGAAGQNDMTVTKNSRWR